MTEHDASAVAGLGGITEHEASAVTGGGGMTEHEVTAPASGSISLMLRHARPLRNCQEG
jgi:hypothetical protein